MTELFALSSVKTKDQARPVLILVHNPEPERIPENFIGIQHENGSITIDPASPGFGMDASGPARRIREYRQLIESGGTTCNFSDCRNPDTEIWRDRIVSIMQ